MPPPYEVAAALLSAPVIATTIWLNVTEGSTGWIWLLLPAGAAYGALVAQLGLCLAAPRTVRRLPTASYWLLEAGPRPERRESGGKVFPQSLGKKMWAGARWS